jgi:3-hydroxy-3-methylglutaryl CoA synthase
MENIISKYRLADEVISHLVQLLQLGLLEGTDVTDHFRRVEMETDENGMLYLSESYQEAFEESLKKMQDFITEQTADSTQGE